MDEIESLERATLAAVPPRAQEELGGWLLGLDDGTVGRAHSAAPLRHAPADPRLARAIAARYAHHGIAPVLRIPALDPFRALCGALAADGWVASKPTLVQTGTTAAMAALEGEHEVELAGAPDAGWAGLFLGEGFDPVDGASRMAILRRASGSVFASIAVDGQVRAVGCGSFSHGWCSVHGMRTAPGWRGRGMAAAILAAVARRAQGHGIPRAFLQVEGANAAAQSLYRRAGFATAWAYEYWK